MCCDAQLAFDLRENFSGTGNFSRGGMLEECPGRIFRSETYGLGKNFATNAIPKLEVWIPTHYFVNERCIFVSVRVNENVTGFVTDKLC